MANQRPEHVSLPATAKRAAPATGIEGLPMLSARGYARAASQSDGSAELFQRAAGVFGEVADTIGTIADVAAQKEGSDAGALAGLDREFRPKGDLTIYGQAFDQAAIETKKSQMAVEVTAQMQKAFDANPANPTGLAQALEGVKAGWQETVDDERLAPHLKPDFEALFLRNHTGLMRDATRAFHANVRAEQAGALEAERETRARTAEQQAYRLGLDATADEVLAGELADMRKRLAVRGPDGQPIVDPVQQVKLLRDTEQSIARARITGAFSRLDDLPSRIRFIDELEKRYQAGGDRVLDLFDPGQYQALHATLSSQARQEELGAAQAERETKRAVKAFGEAAKGGITLKDDEMAGLKARVVATNDPEIIRDFDDAVDTLAMVRQLNMTPPAEIEAFVDHERARLLDQGTSADGREVARLKVAEDYLQNAHTELANDPLGFAAKAGTATVAPLDITDPVSLGLRAATAEHVAGVYGREVKYFRPEEKAAIAAASRKGGDEMIAVATSITAGMGENAPEALAEISKDAPVLAMVGGLWLAAGGKSPPAIARDMARGLELRAMKGFVSQSQTADVKQAAAEVLQSVLSRQETDQAAAINAANAVYDARAYQQGVSSFDGELWKQGLREVLGEREVNGVKFGGVVGQGFWGAHAIVLPPTVKQDALEDVLGLIDAGDLDRANIPRPVGATGLPIAVSRIREGTLVQVGAGQYAVAMGDPDTPGEERWLKANAAGDPFILDLGRIAPELARRRPDLFLGVR
jgi:hypothetical protein